MTALATKANQSDLTTAIATRVVETERKTVLAMKANQSTTNTIVQVDAALHAQVDPSTTYAKTAAST